MRLVLVGLAVLLAGCASTPAPGGDGGTVDATPWETGEALDHCPYAPPVGAHVVRFRVTWAESGDPVPGACVHASLKGASGTTYVRMDAQGERTWRLDAGDHTLIATKPAVGDAYCAHEHAREARVVGSSVFEFALPARAGTCA